MKVPPFDMNAPMDAPIRAREAREKREHEEAMRVMRSPEFKRDIRRIVRRPLKADGTPDRRYGPRRGEPR